MQQVQESLWSLCLLIVWYLQSACSLWPSYNYSAVTPRWSYTGGRNRFLIHLQLKRWSHHHWFGWMDKRCRVPERQSGIKFILTAAQSKIINVNSMFSAWLMKWGWKGKMWCWVSHWSRCHWSPGRWWRAGWCLRELPGSLSCWPRPDVWGWRELEAAGPAGGAAAVCPSLPPMH